MRLLKATGTRCTEWRKKRKKVAGRETKANISQPSSKTLFLTTG
jgi:hypothetical protein